MKIFSYALTLLLIITNTKSALSNSRTEDTGAARTLFKIEEPDGMAMDFNYLNIPFQKTSLEGIEWNICATFKNKCMAGIAMDFTGSKNVSIPTQIKVITPRYSYLCFSGMFEYFILPKSLVNFSIPFKAGVGYAEYRDAYGISRNGSAGQLIASDAFFLAEGGINAYVNVIKSVSLGTGLRYHLASGVSDIGTNREYSGYSCCVNLRLRGRTH